MGIKSLRKHKDGACPGDVEKTMYGLIYERKSNSAPVREVKCKYHSSW